MTPDILDVLRLQSRRLHLVLASAGLPSVHETSKPLRQVMYGLLELRCQVLEMDRVGLHVEEINVQPVITPTLKGLHLLSLPKVIQLSYSNAQCLCVFSEEVLCCSFCCRQSTVGVFGG